MVLAYNEPITFGRFGTAKTLNCAGIDFLEDGNQSWTSAPVAEMDIQLPLARQDVLLELDATPFIIPDIVATQQVFIFVSGLFVGYCTLANQEVRRFLVNRSVISGRASRLTLVIPNAVSPYSLRMSEDMRELGVCLNSLSFKTTT